MSRARVSVLPKRKASSKEYGKPLSGKTEKPVRLKTGFGFVMYSICGAVKVLLNEQYLVK